MSRPIARVTIFVLISLVLIAATSMSVRGWLGGSTEVSGVQAHTVNGLKTNLNHDRSTVSELESFRMQSSPSYEQSGGGHGCEDEAHPVPLD